MAYAEYRPGIRTRRYTAESVKPARKCRTSVPLTMESNPALTCTVDGLIFAAVMVVLAAVAIFFA